jgi:hypothetical protein
MPRYMVERTFLDGLHVPITDEGAIACLGVVDRNADLGVTGVHSYVSEDKTKTCCIYEGSEPDAIRQAPSAMGSGWITSPRCGRWTRTSTASQREERKG